jgi:hypothetical protein
MTKQKGMEIVGPLEILKVNEYPDLNTPGPYTTVDGVCHYNGHRITPDGVLHKASENDRYMTYNGLDASLHSVTWEKIQRLAETPKLIEQRKYLLETEKNYVEGNDPVLDNLLSVLQVKETYIVSCFKLKGKSKYYLVIDAEEPIDKKELGWSYIFWIFSIFGLATLLHVVFSWALWLVSILALCVMSIKLCCDIYLRLRVYVSYENISKKQLILIKNFYKKLNKNKEAEKIRCEIWDNSYAEYMGRPKNEQEYNKWFEKQEKFRKANQIRDQIINEN